jgi:hypothetical protein
MSAHGFVVVDVGAGRVRGEWWHVDTVLERGGGPASRRHTRFRTASRG